MNKDDAVEYATGAAASWAALAAWAASIDSASRATIRAEYAAAAVARVKEKENE